MVLKKNTGFETLSKISKIIDGTESDTAHFPDELNIDHMDMTYMKLVPISMWTRKEVFHPKNIASRKSAVICI